MRTLERRNSNIEYTRLDLEEHSKRSGRSVEKEFRVVRVNPGNASFDCPLCNLKPARRWSPESTSNALDVELRREEA